MTDVDRIAAYADAFLGIARAEGNLGEVEDELFRFARVLEGSDELRTALTDPHLPVARRQQIVEDLLGARALPVTTALVSLAVGTGRARDLPAVVDQLVRLSAAQANKSVAEVRVTESLSDEQLARLTTALEAATGKRVEVKVVIDPTILGGLVAQIDDTVIDGSVRNRLSQLRDAL